MAMVRGAAELKNSVGSGSCAINDQVVAILLATPLPVEVRGECSESFVADADSEVAREGVIDFDSALLGSSSIVAGLESLLSFFADTAGFFAGEIPGFFFRNRELVGRSTLLDSAADSSSSTFGSDSFSCASAELAMQRRDSRIENKVL
jgi:hypothetical protein